MTRRGFLWGIGGGLTAAALGFPGAAAAPSSPRPNIVFLLTDDQRWDTLGCMGNPVVQTPHIDRLAAEGVLFTNGFVTTPVCCVSRTSIVTGQYARRRGIGDLEKICRVDAASRAETYPALLREHGYFTGYIGKYNIGSPDDIASAAMQYDFWAGWKHHGNYWHERQCPNVTNGGLGEDRTRNGCTCPPEGEWPRVGHAGMEDPIHTTTQMIPMKVRQFLAGRDAGRPFCLTIGTKAPKDPWDDFPPELAALYEGVEVPVPETATPEAAAELPEFLRKSLASDSGLQYATNHDELATRIRYYYRCVTALDSTVGSIRRMLDEQGLAENTVIFFMGDNGHFLADHGLWGKWLGYEASIRVPFLVYDPRLPRAQQGQRRDEMVLNIDVAPTILSMAGVPVPDAMDGRDLTPLLQGRQVPRRDAWFYEHTWTADGRIEPSDGVRTERWKYLRYYQQTPVYEQLFDLETDPNETRNLASHEAHRPVLEEMRQRWAGFDRELSRRA